MIDCKIRFSLLEVPDSPASTMPRPAKSICVLAKSASHFARFRNFVLSYEEDQWSVPERRTYSPIRHVLAYARTRPDSSEFPT